MYSYYLFSYRTNLRTGYPRENFGSSLRLKQIIIYSEDTIYICYSDSINICRYAELNLR